MSIVTISIIAILVIVAVVLVVFLIFNSIGFFAGAPYAATPSNVVDRMFKLIDIGEKDVVYDLGSGDGRILIAAAKRGARGVGWEINFPLYLWSVRRIRRVRLSRKIKIHFGNFWTKDFSRATVIFAFLLPKYMGKLERKLNKEVLPGTKVITYLAKLSGRSSIKEANGLSIYQF